MCYCHKIAFLFQFKMFISMSYFVNHVHHMYRFSQNKCKKTDPFASSLLCEEGNLYPGREIFFIMENNIARVDYAVHELYICRKLRNRHFYIYL